MTKLNSPTIPTIPTIDNNLYYKFSKKLYIELLYKFTEFIFEFFVSIIKTV